MAKRNSGNREEEWQEDRRKRHNRFNRNDRGARRHFNNNFNRRGSYDNKRDDNRGFKRKRDDGNGYQNFTQRNNRAAEMSPDERLKKLLIRVGEKSKASLADCLDGLAEAVQRDIQQYEDLILDTLFDCVVHLSVKVPIHATLVGLITIWEPEFGEKVVERLKNNLFQCLTNCDLFRLRQNTRFLGCLQNANVISGVHLTTFLKQLLTAANADDTHLNVKDHLVHIVMSTLYFSGHTLSENQPDKLQELLKDIGDFMDQRQNEESCFYQILQSQQLNFLPDYWTGLKELEEMDWNIGSVVAPHEDFERLKKCNQHPFEISEIPALGDFQNIPHVNHLSVLRLVEPEEELSMSDWCMVGEYLHDIMKVFYRSPALAAEQVINLHLTFDHKFLAMETIFTQMLHLPEPQYNFCYYSRIIIELFDRQPKIWPKAVGRCLLHLFEKMDKLDVELRDRLAEWFAFHLNNFGNSWPWHKWKYVTSLDKNAPKRQWCQEVLRHETHIGNWESIMNLLEEPFTELMPPRPGPYLKYQIKTFETFDNGKKIDR